MARVAREREMSVPRDQLIGVITDFPAYAEFISEVVSAKRLPGGTKEKFRVAFDIEVVKRFTYVLEFNVKGKDEISWHLVEGEFFKKNEGRWVLKETARNKTHATYELEVGFGFLVPGWVTRKLTETNLPKMLENFEERAKRRKVEP